MVKRKVVHEDEPEVSHEEEKTDEAKAMEAKQKEDATLVAAALEKAGKANINLAKDGSATRMDAEVRDGEVRYRWGNFVPTRYLTEDELKAVEAL